MDCLMCGEILTRHSGIESYCKNNKCNEKYYVYVSKYNDSFRFIIQDKKTKLHYVYDKEKVFQFNNIRYNNIELFEAKQAIVDNSLIKNFEKNKCLKWLRLIENEI